MKPEKLAASYVLSFDSLIFIYGLIFSIKKTDQTLSLCDAVREERTTLPTKYKGVINSPGPLFPCIELG